MRPLRTACVLVPQLAVQVALERRPDLAGRPVIVGGYPHQRRTVIGASGEALASGVSPGMPLRQAESLCPDATFLPLDTSLTSEVFASLLRVMESFSPAVEVESAGTIFIDVAGVDLRTLGRGEAPGEAALLQALLQEIRSQTGLHAAIGAGTGKFVARVAASLAAMGEHCSIPPGEEGAALALISINLLPCSRDMRRRLHLYGLHTLGDLAALSAGPVQAQFATEGLRMWRLAGGLDEERVVAASQAQAPSERLELSSPTADCEALVHVVMLLLQRLFRRSEIGTRFARRLALSITLEDGSAWERTITFHEPTADPARALFAVRVRMDGLALPAAAIAVTCTIHDFCGERGRQEAFFSSRGRLVQLDEAIRHLRVRLGKPPVLRVVEVEPWSRIPERRTALTEYVP
jgi:DNA polymerase-4/protein ImuB